MIAEAIQIYPGSREIVQDPSLSEVLFSGRETPPSLKIRSLVEAIVSLGLPDLRADIALLVGFYYFRMGAEKATEALQRDFGAGVENLLGITFAKRGTLERPGMNAIAERICNGLLPDYRDLKAELARRNFILEYPKNR